VGSAIVYLHTECEQCVLHGDIKPANILLDTSCNAKLGDFGLARLVDHGTDSRTTQVVAGTPGYMDPEFVNNGRPSAEADVFSFGVVLLELACGRRPTAARPNATTTPVLLIDWVRDMYHKNTVLGAADRRLDGEFDHQQMRRVLVAGLWCTHHDQSQRPLIAQAMDLLRRQDAELPILAEMRSPATASVRYLEEIAYGDLDLSGEDSGLEDSSADTAYHTSEVSTLPARMLAEE
jgi:serine/threonine protein kinase